MDLAGLPVDRSRLNDIARRHRLRVVEDAAQSMGASWGGERIGASGDLVSISFHANKNITTAEGGCLVLNDDEEARRCELWRLQGVERFADGDLDATLPGGKHNLTDIAARIGLGQLRGWKNSTQRRRRSRAAISSASIARSAASCRSEDFSNSNWHMFQIVLPTDGAARRIHRADARRRHRHRRALSGDSSADTVPAMGFKPGDFPIAEHIGPASRRCHCFRRCAMRTWSACAQAARRCMAWPAHAWRDQSSAATDRSLAHEACRAAPDRVVIPVYNEEEVLPALFTRLYPALDTLARSYEIVFVNDGSRDRSAALLRTAVRTASRCHPRGAVLE